jgi:hypothetical protein
MRRETEAFLNLVRDAEDPTRADEARVQRALRAAIAAGVAPGVAANGSFDGTWFGEALSKLGLSGGKLNLVAIGAALTLATGDAATPPHAADRGSALRATATSGAAAPLDPAAAEPRTQRLDPAPAAPDRGTPALPAAPAAPQSGKARERSKPRARTSGAKAADPAVPVTASSLRAELDLLQRVQAALKRGDAAFALSELDAHRTADSTLLAERRAARILALCKLGRIADARREAAVFAEQHRDSLQRALVAGSCANR